MTGFLAGAANPAPAPSCAVASGQPMDQFSVLWVAGKKLLRLRQFKVSKVKTGCHRAAHQGKVAFGQLLRQTSSPQAPRPGTARPQPDWRRVSTPGTCHLERCRARAVWSQHKVPHLVRLDAVQRRDVARLQQKVDGGGSRPVSVKPRGQGFVAFVAGAVGFFEPASFGMAGQPVVR